MALPAMHLKVSPTPMGCAPGHLSKAIKQLANKALILSHGMIELHNDLQKPALVSRKGPLAEPKQAENLTNVLNHSHQGQPLSADDK